ncbi:Septal ring factor EnvC, activator of murein hydrolases AmiA and AmiB [Bosea sp. 62]|uniref:murein hydrolase activator EnvC family protein n=1 Tax=unclassified Bosea (in: a-proteobacteria) TaxID=2653178 RepID=UPI0012518306|nr:MULTISPECIES: peptidoglycan DD-metalloendopeptidase family protein [unclassified Bosea (in: a-proteobacteria)]CAD5251811.1 Septal ring factor EnvC, activator of murein hydrolases AmiA and AmiB [Bosea sp. 7B]CAD5279913.1 Septal ring factor EnvC, activator of murein hydrolases AmiA and AmiB [Bosea sp. 21B]CAD5281040.1 Septal ring factor EnvC, activator of murein hydrolases AmiA and AmiB [Bosea sp. 46]VVT59486.1 Septal ring factor EnvC, activator of murein hydrolases AmiA and AmiB [Bosea sp. EC
MTRRSRLIRIARTLRLWPVLLCACLSAGHAAAQTAPAPESDQSARDTEQKREEKRAREAELKAIEERLAGSAEARAKLETEIAGIRADRTKLNQALLETTARTQAAEGRIAGLEQRLSLLQTSETAIRRSLESRRGLIGEVLAALQRIGRRPPPAVLVRPEDILEAVRASMLLGAVVPDLRQEITILGTDLAELVRLREAIAEERKSIAGEMEGLAGERRRLASLIEARRTRETSAAQDIEAQRAAGGELAAQARTLRDLVERIEKDISTANRAADAARRALEAETQEQRQRMAQLAFRDPARLAPKAAFQELRGMLPLPVAGSQLRGFGAADEVGAATRGISLSTRANAVVSSPSDGWVVYAGPFRSFGQLLILNAGNGYYVLLAGMQRIDVSLNQFVLAGEPVAVMGETAEAAATNVGAGTGEPVLYIEFRKDGVSIDPTPWWTKSQGEKARG